ncbi:MAG: hypothetical protein ACI4V4_08055 [Eubacterium sp.]
MQLLLDEKTLRCVWGSTGEYWFSRTDYAVHSSSDLNVESSAALMENGFIPFFTISNEELIRAYIRFLNNKKLSAVFNTLSTQEVADTFWKYHSAYSDISDGFGDFEKKYVLDKAISWCVENNIEYKTT